MHGVSNVWHTEIHTAEPLVPESCSLEVEVDIEKLKIYRSPGIDQNLTVDQSWRLCSEIHKLASIWIKEGLSLLQSVRSFIQHSLVKVNSICR